MVKRLSAYWFVPLSPEDGRPVGYLCREMLELSTVNQGMFQVGLSSRSLMGKIQWEDTGNSKKDEAGRSFGRHQFAMLPRISSGLRWICKS